MKDSFQRAKSRNQVSGLGRAQATRCVRVAFILLDQFSLTSFSTALDALNTATTLENGGDYQISTWSLTGGAIRSDVGVTVDTQRLPLARVQHQVLVLVGGHRVRLAPNAALSKVLRRAAIERTMICGLWNAAFHLAQAGLLDSFACVCHPESLAPIKEYHPSLDLSGSGHVLSGRIGTSAEPGAVLDLMLAVMKRCAMGHKPVFEDEIKRLHQPERHQPSFSAISMPNGERLPKPLSVALSMMENNIEEPVDIELIADRVGVSRRQLERSFSRHLKAPPLRYYLELRLTRARQLIVHSNRTLTDVALATGFVSYPHFHRRFKDLFGLPPLEFRATYDSHLSHYPAFQA